MGAHRLQLVPRNVGRMPFIGCRKENNVMSFGDEGWNQPPELSRMVGMTEQDPH